MQKVNIKTNIMLKSAYQILAVIVPLVTTPYIARVLNASDIGIFSYSSSIVNYFLMFAYLGIDTLGCRSIAQVRDNRGDKKRLKETFWEIRSIQAATNVVAILLYCAFCSTCTEEQSTVFTVQIIAMLSGFFDITWFFFGTENFKLTVTQDVIIKIISVVLIFNFVKGPDDLITYIVIMLLGPLSARIVLWFFLIKEIGYAPKIINFKLIRKYMPENLMLFIPVIATSVYHTMDKTMLGLLSDMTNSGYYYNAEKVVGVPLSLITGLGIVIMPRVAAQYASGNKARGNRLLEQSFEVNCCLSLSMSLGTAAVSNEFVPLFLGDKYMVCIPIIKLFAPIMIIKALSCYIQTQYLIPSKNDKIYIKSTIIGAISNLAANLLLIPRYGAVGATIGTLIAELAALTVAVCSINRELNVIKFALDNISYLFAAIGMYLIVRCFALVSIDMLVIKVLLEVAVGILAFALLSLPHWKNGKSVFNAIIVRK